MSGMERYQQSIAAEFEAQKNRVQYFIKDAHWGEDGRYKEIILSDFLKGVLPDNVGVGTGFVQNAAGKLTSQIDIIIYKKSAPCLFKKGDFVILMPESILGIIEVKSNANAAILARHTKKHPHSVIERCEKNGAIIGRKEIFNGIWGYDADIHIKPRSKRTNLGKQLSACEGYLNHICFNCNIFCRYWPNGNPIERHFDPRACFSFYDLSWNRIFDEDDATQQGLAFGYFISNLLESVHRQTSPQVLNLQYYEFLYPLTNTKEMYRYDDCDIKIESQL